MLIELRMIQARTTRAKETKRKGTPAMEIRPIPQRAIKHTTGRMTERATAPETKPTTAPPIRQTRFNQRTMLPIWANFGWMCSVANQGKTSPKWMT